MPPGHREQIPLLLLVSAKPEHHFGGEIGKAQSDAHTRIPAAELFDDQDIIGDPTTLAPVFLGKMNTDKTQITRFLPDLERKGVFFLPPQYLFLVVLALNELSCRLLYVPLLFSAAQNSRSPSLSSVMVPLGILRFMRSHPRTPIRPLLIM